MKGSLTEKEIQLMEKVKKEWLDRLFVKRKRLNKKRATKLIHWLYEFSHLEKPLVIFVDSPAGAEIAANILNGNQVRDQVRRQVENQVGNQVGRQVWNQVGNQVWNQVWNQVGSQVGSQVGNQVRSQVRRQVENQVGNQVWNQVWNQVGRQVENQDLEFYYFSSYGNIWDMSWLSFYDFFDRIGIDLGDKTNFYKFKELIQTGIYDMIQLDKYCIVCEYPKKILRDEHHNLHSEEAPAIEWRDGYTLWFLHGIAFEYELWKDIIDKKLSFKDCMKLENIEQRMMALKYLDPETLLKEANATLTSKVRGYELYEIEKLFPSTQYFLKYTCPSTGRIYISGIIPSIGSQKDAIKALKWKFYLDDDESEIFTAES